MKSQRSLSLICETSGDLKMQMEHLCWVLFIDTTTCQCNANTPTKVRNDWSYFDRVCMDIYVCLPQPAGRLCKVKSAALEWAVCVAEVCHARSSQGIGECNHLIACYWMNAISRTYACFSGRQLQQTSPNQL